VRGLVALLLWHAGTRCSKIAERSLEGDRIVGFTALFGIKFALSVQQTYVDMLGGQQLLLLLTLVDL